MPSFHAAASYSSADLHRSTATATRSRGFIAEKNSAPLMLRPASSSSALMLYHIPIFPNHPILCLPSLSPLFPFAPIQQWKALPMKDLILGRMVMDASIIGENARLELPAATKSSIVVIVTMNPQYYDQITHFFYLGICLLNYSMSMLSSPFVRHELVRSDIKQVICSICDTEQPVVRVCTNCGVNMGEYFCEVCKFYDDDAC